jgi:hypothetical protein
VQRLTVSRGLRVGVRPERKVEETFTDVTHAPTEQARPVG